ncbi:MAG: hypothetical protein HY951_06385 [Bacteroidia bacterium]|nr:hypothetical protein [Bacteroidia bacterium]
MKSISFIAILILFAYEFGYTQQLPKVEVSKPYPVIESKKVQYFLQNENLIAVKDNNIQSFDVNQLSLINSFEYSIPEGADKEYIGKIGNKDYLFYSISDVKLNTTKLFYKELSTDETKAKLEGKLLLTVNAKINKSVFGPYYSEQAVKNFSFNFSFNSTKLLIIYKIESLEKDKSKFNELIGFYVFNSDLNLERGKEIKMPYTRNLMTNYDYTIDEKGNIYIISRVFNSNTGYYMTKDGKPNIHIEILKLASNTDSITTIPVLADEKFINDLSFYQVSSDFVICAGYTYKGKKLQDRDKFIVFKIEHDGSFSDKKFYEFPPEFNDIIVRNISVNSDKNIFLIGESYNVNDKKVKSAGTIHESYAESLFGDMSYAKINNEGSLEFIKRLPKNQSGFEKPGGMSFKCIENEQYRLFLFLDKKDNLTIPLDVQPKEYSEGNSGYLMAYKIHNNDGKIDKTPIFSTENIQNNLNIEKLIVKNIIPISQNAFILEANISKKENVLIKVIF